VTFPVLDWHLNNRHYSEADARMHLGRVPLLINPESPDPVYRQVEDNYPAGWCPILGDERDKWTFTGDAYLVYPGLPPLAPAAMAWHQAEQIFVYPAGWVVVTTLDGEFTLARIEP
jgi:hypothetical protein